jgi:hypothetical protein
LEFLNSRSVLKGAVGRHCDKEAEGFCYFGYVRLQRRLREDSGPAREIESDKGVILVVQCVRNLTNSDQGHCMSVIVLHGTKAIVSGALIIFLVIISVKVGGSTYIRFGTWKDSSSVHF